MSYNKQTWATGDTVTAAKLNHMEDGIAAASGGGVLVVGGTPSIVSGNLAFTLDKKFFEIMVSDFAVLTYEPDDGVEMRLPLTAVVTMDGSLSVTFEAGDTIIRAEAESLDSYPVWVVPHNQ